MNGVEGDFGQVHWKVGNPNSSNNIPQMRSNCFQAPFIAGGNQVAYYLGLRSNATTDKIVTPSLGEYSAYKKVIKTHKR